MVLQVVFCLEDFMNMKRKIVGKQMVPDGCYYLLGDNAEHSMDSRYWENPFVKKEK